MLMNCLNSYKDYISIDLSD